jgi:hypothetical protein
MQHLKLDVTIVRAAIADNYQCLREIGGGSKLEEACVKCTFGHHNNHESCKHSFTALP